jgi:hypothetical protein
MDRKAITNRDVFDCWFFMNSKTPLNKSIVEQRMGMSLPDYLQKCIDMLQTMSDKGLLNGLGELMDDEMKNFVRHKLRTESITLMKFYKQFPVI